MTRLPLVRSLLISLLLLGAAGAQQLALPSLATSAPLLAFLPPAPLAADLRPWGAQVGASMPPRAVTAGRLTSGARAEGAQGPAPSPRSAALGPWGPQGGASISGARAEGAQGPAPSPRSAALGPWGPQGGASISGARAEGAQGPAPSNADFPAAGLPQRHPMAIQYPPGYYTRLKIHKIASFATLPLFAAEVALGTSLYNNPQQRGGRKAAHGLIGAGIVGLFGVNTVTGLWNLYDARNDPSSHGLVLAHSLLMLVADAGFVATSMSGPKTRGPEAVNFHSQALRHRNLAYFSIGIATVGYALMLFRHH